MGSYLCFTYVHDLEPEPLDPNNIHQQFEIQPYGRGTFGPSGFVAKSITPDGIASNFLRKKRVESAYLNSS